VILRAGFAQHLVFIAGVRAVARPFFFAAAGAIAKDILSAHSAEPSRYRSNTSGTIYAMLGEEFVAHGLHARLGDVLGAKPFDRFFDMVLGRALADFEFHASVVTFGRLNKC
jgi:hypothetical protein